jgi:hypothetical protein
MLLKGPFGPFNNRLPGYLENGYIYADNWILWWNAGIYEEVNG